MALSETVVLIVIAGVIAVELGIVSHALGRLVALLDYIAEVMRDRQ